MAGTLIPQHGPTIEVGPDGKKLIRTKVLNDATDPIPVVVNPASIPKIYNLSAPLANTEVSQVLSADTKQLIIRVRGNARLQIAFNVGESSTNYLTIPAGASLSLTDLKTSATLYVQTDKNSQVIEILEWT